MAQDLRQKILKLYRIDIDDKQNGNLLKLYGLDKTENPTDRDLEEHFARTREKWEKSINGTNEKYAARDRERLANADTYETILRDAQLRKELYAYFAGGKNKGAGETDERMLSFAREYFRLVASTKQLSREDVDFFFRYYKITKAGLKSDIEKMLIGEFKVRDLAIGGRERGNDKAKEGEEKQEKPGSRTGGRIVNLFDEGTVLSIRKCFDNFELAAQKEILVNRYPELKGDLYEYLKLDQTDSPEYFRNQARADQKQAYDLKQNRGMEYAPLVDLCNSVCSLYDRQDVRDNFEAFRLLIRYPNLTPYMFAFVEMQPETMDGMSRIAQRTYENDFYDSQEFIMDYYLPVSGHFGISNTAVQKILKDAQREFGGEESISDLLTFRRGCRYPWSYEALYLFAYWPIYLTYLLFECCRLIFMALPGRKKEAFPVMLVLTNLFYPLLGMPNVFAVTRIFTGTWVEFLESFLAFVDITSWMEVIVVSLVVLVIMVAVYGASSYFLSRLICNGAGEVNKQFDWVGYQRTFDRMIRGQRRKLVDQINRDENTYTRSCLIRGVINLALQALVVWIAVG